MEKLHDLKMHICALENLYGAYFDAIEDKRYRTDILCFTANLDENIFSLREELLNETYEVGPYREFYVRYPKPRLVMALGFRDRIVQWAIYRQLNPYVDKRFIAHSYGCRKGKGTLAAAECLYNWLRLIDRKADADDWVIIKGDISKYFYRVNHDKTLDIYEDYTDDDWFLRLMCRIIKSKVPFGLPRGMRADDCPREQRIFGVGMPIGNLTSQETGNIYLNRLDMYCKHVLSLRYYARYMDDFVIPCKKDEAEATLNHIDGYLQKELLLELNPKSCIIPAREGCEFVGYKITPYGMQLRPQTVRHIKASLNHVADMYANRIIDIDRALATLRSYFGMTKHCDAQELRQWIAEHIVFAHKEVAEDGTKILPNLPKE